MSKDYTNKAFKDLLDKLQQESWQLELLISGFAIFGLFSALGALEVNLNEAKALEKYTRFFYPIALTSCYVLIVNLIIHVLLRGLWIGAIGLRYVSDEIDYGALKYSKRFTRHLEKKVGSFDKYIGNLEDYCSILFAVTFLSLFYIIAFFLSLFVIMVAGYLFIGSGYFGEMTGTFLLGIFGIFYAFISFIVFLDFATQGLLKKKEWTSFLYLPIYKVFTVLTLSFLYRPLVYNFLDNKFGKRLLLALLPIYVGVFYLSTMSEQRSNYVLKETYSSVNYTYKNNYLNALEKGDYISQAAIQSKVVSEPFLNVFIPFRKKIEDFVYLQDSLLKQKEDHRGLKSNFFKFKTKYKNQDSLTTSYLKAFKKAYIVKIDSKELNTDFLITEINNQLGFETILPLKNVKEGNHLLTISRFVEVNKTKKIKKETVIEIPFWYYKN